MPDETAPVRNPDNLQTELEKSRQSAVRLMDNLARKIGADRAVRKAATGVQSAAQFLQEHGWNDVAAGINRAVRRRPGAAILVAVAAGFLVGRALRSR